MNILVFDDSAIHRQSAKLLLADHHVTIVGTYDQAQALLVPQTNYDLKKQLFVERYGDDDPYKKCEKHDERLAYHNGECDRLATKYPDFDAFLGDLLVPASRQVQGDEGMKLAGQEMPLGTTIALLALFAGIKMVAIVTDKNHHDHPASAAFDCFEFNKNRLRGAKLLCTNNCCLVQIDKTSNEIVDEGFLESEEGKVKYPYKNGNGWGERDGLVLAKDWDEILDRLSSLPESE